jgi:hypothetical protein
LAAAAEQVDGLLPLETVFPVKFESVTTTGTAWLALSVVELGAGKICMFEAFPTVTVPPTV